MVRSELVAAGAENCFVEMPTTTPEGFSETTVPDIRTLLVFGRPLFAKLRAIHHI